MFTVYKATSPSNKVYIGITSKSFARRKIQHLSAAVAGSDYAFHRAIRKYDSSIKWEILTEVATLDSAISMEKSFIAELGSFGPHGYNMTSGGEGQLGASWGHSEEAKNKISQNNGRFWTGKTRSEETKRKCSEAQRSIRRKPFSEEHKANLSAAALKRYALQRVA